MPSETPAPRSREEHRHPEVLEDLILVPEAARRLGLSTETLYRLIRSGAFPPAVRLGRSVRVSVPKLHPLPARGGRMTSAGDPETGSALAVRNDDGHA